MKTLKQKLSILDRIFAAITFAEKGEFETASQMAKSDKKIRQKKQFSNFELTPTT